MISLRVRTVSRRWNRGPTSLTVAYPGEFTNHNSVFFLNQTTDDHSLVVVQHHGGVSTSRVVSSGNSVSPD